MLYFFLSLLNSQVAKVVYENKDWNMFSKVFLPQFLHVAKVVYENKDWNFIGFLCSGPPIAVVAKVVYENKDWNLASYSFARASSIMLQKSSTKTRIETLLWFTVKSHFVHLLQKSSTKTRIETRFDVLRSVLLGHVAKVVYENKDWNNMIAGLSIKSISGCKSRLRKQGLKQSETPFGVSDTFPA